MQRKECLVHMEPAASNLSITNPTLQPFEQPLDRRQIFSAFIFYFNLPANQNLQLILLLKISS